MSVKLIRAWGIQVGRGAERTFLFLPGRRTIFAGVSLWPTRSDARNVLSLQRALKRITTRFARVVQVRITAKVVERKR